MPKHVVMNRALLFVAVLVGIAGGLFLLSTLNPVTNDDAFVYYNYARNFVAGRPFAYDPRNIPSEGFTSLLYLLLLVPFEFLHVNLTFISTAVNVLALGLTVLVATWLAYRSKALNNAQALVFGSILWVLLVSDRHIHATIAWGLESLLGPLVVVLCAAALWLAGSPDSRRSTQGLTAFFALLFLAYLTRPESMVFIAIAGSLILFNSGIHRRRIIRADLIFAAVFVSYHAFKYLLYGDIFPTGFYRKVGDVGGLSYVNEWLIAYCLLVIAFMGLAVFSLAVAYVTRRWSLFRQRWIWFLLAVSLMTIAFFIATVPLIGVGYRFLITPTITLYLITVLLGVWLAGKVIDRFVLRERSRIFIYIVILAALCTLTGLHWWRTTDATNRFATLNIYERAVQATNDHIYLKIGNALHEALANPEAITLAFGDAGALPYALDSRFIDTNGLTEPFIARLFRLEDGEMKTRLYVDYIIRQQPDLVVLAYGDLNMATGMWDIPINNHSPFNGYLPAELYTAYRDSGIVYVCSINSYSALHMGVRLGSPQADALVEALSEYCANGGYRLPDGLIVRSPDGQIIIFPTTAEQPDEQG